MDMGGGLYRVSGTAAAGAAVANSGVIKYGTNNNRTFKVSGYQLEPVTYQTLPSTYVATTTAAYYAPRFDYDPVTLAPKGLLIEEQRTNVILTSTFATLAGTAGSQYPSGTGWSEFFSTGGTRTYVASSVFPGAQAMDIVGVSGARNLIGFNFIAASSTTYTVSFYVESVSDVTGIVSYVTGTLGTGGSTNSITAPTTTGRYSYTFTTGTSAGTVFLRFGIGASANANGSIRISNVQCEAGAFATSYIPTVASQVTRSADVATMTGTNFSSWYNQPQGTFVVSADTVKPTTAAVTCVITSADDGTSANRLMVRYLTANIEALNIVSSVIETQLQKTYSSNSVDSAAFAYAASDFAFTTNGGAVLTDATGSVPVVNRLNIGNTVSVGQLNGHIRQIAFYNTRLPNATLQALTA
jgi:hypothetical protein